MSEQLTWLIIGFLAGFLPCVGLAAWYYVRALKRVRSIQAQIQQFKQASKVVGEAADSAYRNQ